MAFVSVSGESGCRHEELARIAAQRLGFELITEARLRDTISQDFSAHEGIPDKAWPHLATSILSSRAVERNLVVAATGSEMLFPNFPAILRIHVIAPESRRIGHLIVERGLDRPKAKELLQNLERQQAALRRQRFGKSQCKAQTYDLILNAGTLEIEHMADILERAVESKGLLEQGLLTAAAEAQIQFQVRLKLAGFGIVPPDRLQLRSKEFGHPSEEVFANLLDFYRIGWDYEPRSFPLQWDKDGKVLEAFTPDFYLPDFDLYVELTTMKQANVTKKNRKIRLLRAIYPHIKIQIFYQKDVQELVIKYELPGRVAQ